MPGASSRSDGVRSWRTFAARVPARVAAHWRFKAMLAAVVAFTFCVPYFLIGNYPLLPVRKLPLTWLDRAIGSHPQEWVWVYQSEYLLVNALPWLAERRGQLVRYVRGFSVLSLIAFAVFILVPIRAPEPDVANPSGMYWLLKQYDVPLNCLPSLHAALIVYTLAFGNRVAGRAAPRSLKLFVAAWAALILYSTVATKEHYVVDVVAGVLLALAWVWRRGSRGGGVEEDPAQQREDVPRRRAEVMVGAADGVNVAGQAGHVAQQDAAAVVGAERG
jgi:hypothetical protein